DRLIFPIRNHQGVVSAFGGRTMHGKGSGAKYLNTSETAVYVKGHFLYGIGDLSPSAHKICIHEGYMDSLICNMHGVPSYAICGSSMTGEQADLVLSRHVEVILMFDGDQAGLKATYKALEVLLPRVRPRHVIRVVRLPEGLDPDEFLLASGADAMTALRDTAPLATDWIFRGLEAATLQERVTLIEWIKAVGVCLTGSFGDAFAMELKERGINLQRKVATLTPVVRQDYHSLPLALKMTAIILNQPDFARRSTFSPALMPEPVRTLSRVIRSRPEATAASVIAMLTPDWQKGVKPAADVQIPELSPIDCEAIYLETALEKAEAEWKSTHTEQALSLCDVLRDRLERLDEDEPEHLLIPDVTDDFEIPLSDVGVSDGEDDADHYSEQRSTGT
ncbi:toprim domain-containing protein, partial [Nevskia ramosa]|uniref:toprim domain-containing protein n=1 Tax=Nevskia ramosa TaxID=64002 RepID=UPI00235335D6